MNLSAPFLCQFFKDPMDQTSVYWDYIFGNESEAAAWAEAHSLATKDIKEIASHIAKLPKANAARPRVVVITQGADPTIVAIATEEKVDVKEYPTPKVPSEEIIDSNGAGDAFAGAFLGKLILGSDIETCVKAGQWLAGLSLRSNGPAYLPLPLSLEINFADIHSQSKNSKNRHRDELFIGVVEWTHTYCYLFGVYHGIQLPQKTEMHFNNHNKINFIHY